MMRVAILDPFSGIAGDMTLGALLQLGLPDEWLRDLPRRVGLPDVGVKIREVHRAGIACRKVDFDIPSQPHGRHIRQIRELVNGTDAPQPVKERADAAFTALATVEAEIHGTTIDRVHLHEVGAVDAILDVVGSIWAMDELRVERVYCGTVALGDGSVQAAHGRLPVPAPATLKLLEGHAVRPGPEGSGELVTPTGAALVRILSSGPPPSVYTPLRSGFGAGTKEFTDRPNALRIVLAEAGAVDDGNVEDLVLLSCDIDDMSGEYVAEAAERLRQAGALDVVMTTTVMKKGRPGTRLEALTRPADAGIVEDTLLAESTSIGVRRTRVTRRALPRETVTVEVLGRSVKMKVVTLPDGSQRAKPEFSDVARIAMETGRPLHDIFVLASGAAERR